MTEFSPAQKRKYLARVLQLNPLVDSEKILTFRSAILGLSIETLDADDTLKIQRLRLEAKQKIDALRRQFWTMSPEVLTQELNSLDVRKLPDLEHTVSRLRLIAGLIPQFNQLSKHPQTRINMLNTLKRMIMLPPREAGEIKSAYLRKAAYANALPIVQQMVMMMYNEFPQIYALESDWFFEISKLQQRHG